MILFKANTNPGTDTTIEHTLSDKAAEVWAALQALPAEVQLLILNDVEDSMETDSDAEDPVEMVWKI